MIRKTLSTAVAVAVISGSALFATTAPSNAHYYGYSNYYSYYEPVCFYTWKRVWTYYGFRKIKVQICR